MARDKSHKLMAAIPSTYTPDFIESLDRESTVGRAVLELYEAIVTDLGGIDALSTVRERLVCRFCWFEAMIQGIECQAAVGEPVDIGAWTQLVNSWLGIARQLGLERKPRRVRGLHEIMRGTTA